VQLIPETSNLPPPFQNSFFKSNHVKTFPSFFVRVRITFSLLIRNEALSISSYRRWIRKTWAYGSRTVVREGGREGGKKGGRRREGGR